MWKKLVVVGLLVGAGVVAAKSSSYVGTWCQNFRKQVTASVPRSFEIDRVRYQIARLDDEIKAKFGPIAEKMAEADELNAHIKAGRVSVERQAKQLKDLTEQVEAKSAFVTVESAKLTAAEARARLARDFRHLKQTRSLLEQKEKRLHALEKTIARSREHVERLSTQKVEFERQLAELELREQELTMEREASPVKDKDGLVADIKSTLDSIKRGQTVERAKHNLAREFEAKVTQPDAEPEVSTQEVRRFLDGAPPMPKVVKADQE